ncbi:MAG TPA: transcription antitermination factor NusB [Humibacter sp.]|nr:transcription antitermination factor NusB [Humibacter sp.]
MSARSKARKRAIDVLYSADLRGVPLASALADEAQRAASEPSREASWLYAREVVDGVIDHGDEIDELIQTYAQGWTLERMPAVDRAILRMGVWEMLYNPDVPDGVAISEAVDQATILSTDDSAKFVNGLLAKIGAAVAH